MELLTIGQAAEKMGIKVTRLSYLARQGRVPVAQRTASGRKLFNPIDLNSIDPVSDRMEINHDFYSVTEAAKVLGLSVASIYKKVKSRVFKTCDQMRKDYKGIFILKQEVDWYLEDSIEKKAKKAESKKSQEILSPNIPENAIVVESPDLSNLSEELDFLVEQLDEFADHFRFSLREAIDEVGCLDTPKIHSQAELIEFTKKFIVNKLMQVDLTLPNEFHSSIFN